MRRTGRYIQAEEATLGDYFRLSLPAGILNE